jgi:hypothetical protein
MIRSGQGSPKGEIVSIWVSFSGWNQHNARMAEARHLTREDLEAWLDEIRRSPKDGGVLHLIVRRPQTGEREVVQEAQLDPAAGLVGDDWKTRGCAGTPDGSADPEAQITMIGSRVIAHLAQGKERWPLSGDQLFLDLDLSGENLPAGTRLALGSAVIEITEQPHTGCKKFVSHYGKDAMQFVNSPVGKQLRLRGVNAKVVTAGVIRAGDVAKKIKKI